MIEYIINNLNLFQKNQHRIQKKYIIKSPNSKLSKNQKNNIGLKNQFRLNNDLTPLYPFKISNHYINSCRILSNKGISVYRTA